LINDFEDGGDRPSGLISMESRPHNELVLHMHKFGAAQPVTIWVRRLSFRSRLANQLRAHRPLGPTRSASSGLRGRGAADASPGPEVVDLDRFDSRTAALWMYITIGDFDFT